VPACAGLYLTRRTTLQQILRLSLFSEHLPVDQALAIGLIDQISDNPASVVERLAVRASRLQPGAVARVKRFIRELGIVPAREEASMAETARGMDDPEVREAITGFVRLHKFPWD
jgi:enoyl-CoA hydratase/carnithine racemase